MALKVGQAFLRTSANPIDESLVMTKAQMLGVNENLMPDNYFCVCSDNGKFYTFAKDATPSAETGKFVEVGIRDLLDDVPAVGNRSSFLEEHVGDIKRFEGGMYYYLYKSYDDGLALFNGDLTQYYWRVKYENGGEEFVELRNRRADTDTRFRYDLFKAFTDIPYNQGVIGSLNSATFAVSRPNQSQTQWANGRIDVIGTYGTNYTEAKIGHPRAMSMTPYAKTTIKKVSDIVKADLFAQGIIEERGSDWGVAKAGKIRFAFASKTATICDMNIDISELGLTSTDDYVIQMTISGGGVMDWGASELWTWGGSATSIGVTCRNAINQNNDFVDVDYVVVAKGFGGGSGGGGGTVDQTYNPTSTNAQSGTAVAEALATVDGSTNFDVATIPQGPTGANEINAVLSNKDNESTMVSYVRQSDGTLPNAVRMNVRSGFGEDSFELPTKALVDAKQNKLVGGLKGQVPVKLSAADGDMEWRDVEDAFSNQKKYVIGDYVNAITNFTNGVSNTGVALHPYESRLFKIFHTVEGTATETICYVDERRSQTSTTPYVYHFEDLDTYGRSYTMDVEYTTVPRPNPNPQGIPPVIQVPQWTCDDTTVTKIEIYNATVSELIRTLPTGGSAGQVLVKQSDIDGDAAWGDGGDGSGTVDQTYDATSTNAQSGTAVAEAVGATNTRVTALETLTNGLTQLTITMVDGNNVSHTYKLLGMEVTNP